MELVVRVAVIDPPISCDVDGPVQDSAGRRRLGILLLIRHLRWNWPMVDADVDRDPVCLGRLLQSEHEGRRGLGYGEVSRGLSVGGDVV